MGILLDLVLTVFFYLLVPAFFCWQRKSFTKKQIEKIVLINGAVIWIIFRIIRAVLTGEPGTGSAVFLWSAAAYWLLKKYCLVEENEKEFVKTPQTIIKKESLEISRNDHSISNIQKAKISDNSPKNEILFCSKCGNKLGAGFLFCNKCGTKINPDNQN